jgi:hypothetical protein
MYRRNTDAFKSSNKCRSRGAECQYFSLERPEYKVRVKNGLLLDGKFSRYSCKFFCCDVSVSAKFLNKQISQRPAGCLVVIKLKRSLASLYWPHFQRHLRIFFVEIYKTVVALSEQTMDKTYFNQSANH